MSVTEVENEMEQQTLCFAAGCHFFLKGLGLRRQESSFNKRVMIHASTDDVTCCFIQGMAAI